MKTFITIFTIIFIAGCTKGAAPVDEVISGPSSITTWKDNVHGAIYNKATNSVAYSRADANGIFKIYISDAEGNNEKPVTYSGWPAYRQQWVEEWDPTGQYLFCYVEKKDYVNESGHTRSKDDAIPGYGGYTDIWLLKRDGSIAWQLTDLPNNYDNGIIHGAISQDGKLFAWTQRVKAPNVLDANMFVGAYDFKVADITYGSNPSLSNIRTYRPGNVLAGGELESFSPDKTNLLFYSTFETKNIFATPVYKLDLQTGATTKLTTESFAQAPTYTPDGQHIVYMTGKDAEQFPFQVQGSDWWIMDKDGNNKRRLTFMNVKDNPQSQNKYKLAGCVSFIDNNTFLGGVQTQPLGLVGYTVKVKFK